MARSLPPTPLFHFVRIFFIKLSLSQHESRIHDGRQNRDYIVFKLILFLSCDCDISEREAINSLIRPDLFIGITMTEKATIDCISPVAIARICAFSRPIFPLSLRLCLGILIFEIKIMLTSARDTFECFNNESKNGTNDRNVMND